MTSVSLTEHIISSGNIGTAEVMGTMDHSLLNGVANTLTHTAIDANLAVLNGKVDQPLLETSPVTFASVTATDGTSSVIVDGAGTVTASDGTNSLIVGGAGTVTASDGTNSLIVGPGTVTASDGTNSVIVGPGTVAASGQISAGSIVLNGTNLQDTLDGLGVAAASYALPGIITQDDTDIPISDVPGGGRASSGTNSLTLVTHPFDLATVMNTTNGNMMFLNVSGRNECLANGDPAAVSGTITVNVKNGAGDVLFASSVDNTLTSDNSSSWNFDVLFHCDTTDTHITSSVKKISVGDSTLVSDYIDLPSSAISTSSTITVEVVYDRPEPSSPGDGLTSLGAVTMRVKLLGFRMYTNN